MWLGFENCIQFEEKEKSCRILWIEKQMRSYFWDRKKSDSPAENIKDEEEKKEAGKVELHWSSTPWK